MKDYVLIATFQYATDIAVLRTKLDFEQIKYFIENENIISIDPFASIAYGGIKLKVHKKDLERALVIIDIFQSPLKKV
jgi:hypothetical protein